MLVVVVATTNNQVRHTATFKSGVFQEQTKNKQANIMSKLNQQQKKYASKRIDELAQDAILELNNKTAPPEAQEVEDLTKELANVRADKDGMIPRDAAYLTKVVEEAIANLEPSDNIWTGYYSRCNVDLSDLIQTSREGEVLSLEKEIASLEAVLEKHSEKVDRTISTIGKSATKAKDSILLGGDGLEVLEEFTKEVSLLSSSLG